MVLEFREFSKKIKKDTILELDFKVETGEILTIINNKTENLELLKDSFRKRTKFKGEILFDNEDVSKQQLLFTKDFGFYNDLTLIKNLKVALELFNIKVSVDNITEDLEFLNLKPGSKYRDLLPNEINKFHILFSILVDQNVLIIDNTNKDLTVEDMEVVSDFTDGIKSYYGNLEDLLVLKQLTAINISSNENLETVLSGYQYTIYHENEIVVREEVLEEVVYSLLKNNIEVYQIRNLGEKIKLYEGEADL